MAGRSAAAGILIVSPSGKLLGMPLSMLNKSPFTDFLIPGLILFVVLGLVPCGLVFALLKKPVSEMADRLNVYPDMYWAWTGSIYVAFALIIWIQVELFFLQSVHWSHVLYMVWAIAILFVALLPTVRGLYKSEITGSGGLPTSESRPPRKQGSTPLP